MLDVASIAVGAFSVLIAVVMALLMRPRDAKGVDTVNPANHPQTRVADEFAVDASVKSASPAGSAACQAPAPASRKQQSMHQPCAPAVTSAGCDDQRVKGPDRIGGGDLRIWQREAVRRLLERHAGSPHVDAAALGRRIRCFLDDRPRYVASGCVDGQARIFDIRSARRQLVSVRHDTGSRDAINSLLLAPGPVLLTATWDGKRHEWDTWPTRPQRPTEFARGEPGVGHDNLVTGVALSRDGTKLAVACTVGRILVFRGDCPKKEVVVTERDDLVALKDATKLGDYGEFYLKEPVVLAGVRFEEQDELLVEAAFEDKKSRRDIEKLDLPAVLRFRFTGCLTRGHKKAWRRLEHDGSIRCMVLISEGAAEFLYSGSRDRFVKKWDLTDGSLVHTYEGHTSMVRCLTVNTKYVVSGGDDRTLRVWQKSEARLLRTIAAHGDFVRAVCLCPNLTSRAVSAGDDQKVILWDVAIGVRLIDFAHPAIATSLYLNASLLVTGCEDSRVRVWHVESATVENALKHPGAVNAISCM